MLPESGKLTARRPRVHHIVQLIWSDHDSSPVLRLRAELNNDLSYLSSVGPRGYSLEGEYLAIDSFDGILVWNWKNDTVCTMVDTERREWVDCHFLIELDST